MLWFYKVKMFLCLLAKDWLQMELDQMDSTYRLWPRGKMASIRPQHFLRIVAEEWVFCNFISLVFPWLCCVCLGWKIMSWVCQAALWWSHSHEGGYTSDIRWDCADPRRVEAICGETGQWKKCVIALPRSVLQVVASCSMSFGSMLYPFDNEVITTKHLFIWWNKKCVQHFYIGVGFVEDVMTSPLYIYLAWHFHLVTHSPR